MVEIRPDIHSDIEYIRNLTDEEFLDFMAAYRLYVINSIRAYVGEDLMIPEKGTRDAVDATTIRQLKIVLSKWIQEGGLQYNG